jgi:hypothetical protein
MVEGRNYSKGYDEYLAFASDAVVEPRSIPT